MRVFKFFTIIMIIISTFSMVAQDVKDNCALDENGNVKPYDMSICKDDIAFSVIYDNFGGIYNDYIFQIFKFSGLSEDDLDEKNSLTASLKVTNLISAIFKSLIDVSMFFILIVVFYNLIIGVLRTLSDGTFMGNDFKGSKQGWVYLIAIFLLIPIGDIFVVHFIIFTLMLFALIPANMVYGYFLYTLMIAIPDNVMNDGSVDFEERDHNYYYASRHIETLVGSELCRINSFNYILDNYSDRLNNTRLNQNLRCNLPSLEKKYDQIVYDPEGSYFFDITGSPLSGSDSKPIMLSTMGFGKSHHPHKCGISSSNKNNINFYDCGQIELPEINMNSSNIMSFISEEFIDSVKAVVSSIGTSNFNSDLVYTEMLLLMKKVEQKSISQVELIEGNNGIDSNALKNYGKEYQIAKDFINPLKSSNFRSEIIFNFHAAIKNHLKVGTYIFEPEFSGGNYQNNKEVYINSEYFDYMYEQSKELATMIMDIACAKTMFGISKTLDALSRRNVKGLTTLCYNAETNGAYGESLGYIIEDDRDFNEADLQVINNNVIEHQNLLSNKYDELVDKLNQAKRSVDESMSKSLVYFNTISKDGGKKVKFAKARQEGFLSYPKILLLIDHSPSEYMQQRSSLSKSYSSTFFFRKSDYISAAVYDNDYSGNDSFRELDFNYNILEQYKDYSYNNEYVDDSTTTSMSATYQDAENVSSGLFKRLFSFDAINPIVSSMGLSRSSIIDSESIDYNEACGNVETAHLCPLPPINPLVAFNRVGIDYIDLGVKASLVSLAGPLADLILKKSVSNVLGEGSTKAQRSRRINNPVGIAEGVGKLLTDVLKIFGAIFAVIGALFIVFGIILALFIPLIPFVYMVVNFVRWLIGALNLLIVSPLFVGYLFNFKDNEKPITDFFKNNLFQLLLTPFIVILGMIFLWSIYYIMVFFVNITIFSYFSNIPAVDGFIAGVFSSLISLGVLVLVMFMLTRYVFSFITSLSDSVFEMLDIKDVKNDDRSVLDNLFVFSMIQGKYDQIRDGLGSGRKSIQARADELGQVRASARDSYHKLKSEDSPDEFEDAFGNIISKDGLTVKKGGNVSSFNSEEDVFRYLVGADVVSKEEQLKLENKIKLYKDIMKGDDSMYDGANFKDMSFRGVTYQNKSQLADAIMSSNVNGDYGVIRNNDYGGLFDRIKGNVSKSDVDLSKRIKDDYSRLKKHGLMYDEDIEKL